MLTNISSTFYWDKIRNQVMFVGHVSTLLDKSLVSNCLATEKFHTKKTYSSFFHHKFSYQFYSQK